MEMVFSENRETQTLTARVSGDCDLYSAGDLFTGMIRGMAGGYKMVYIDFSGLVYLDSSGIGAIIKIVKFSRDKKIPLRFRGIQGSPRRVLKMSNILTLLAEDRE
jgi:anti-anti-sigma factor